MIKWYLKSNLILRIFIGLALGIICGLWFGHSMEWVKPFGDIFVRLLKMIMIPIVVTSLVVGTSSIDPKSLGRIGGKLFLFYLFFDLMGILIGLLFAHFLKPGLGISFTPSSSTTTSNIPINPHHSSSIGNTIVNIVPDNIFKALAEGNMFSLIFFSIILGIALSFLKDSENQSLQKAGYTLSHGLDAIAKVMFILIKGIMQYTPIGIFALMAVLFGEQGIKAIAPLANLVITDYLAFFTLYFILFSLVLLAFRIPILKFFKGVKNSAITAFVTRSSQGTLPVSMKDCEEIGISKPFYSFSLPIGAALNNPGGATHLAVASVFVGFAIGAPLSLSSQITVAVSSLFISLSSGGVPGVGPILILSVLESIGIKVEAGSLAAGAYALILGIDAILDMGRTAINVTGTNLATLCVAKMEKQFDLEKFKSQK